MSAAKKFTARKLPDLFAIATGRGFESSKCDAKCYDFALPHHNKGQRVALGEGDMQAAREFADEVERTFHNYDISVDNRHNFVRVSWRAPVVSDLVARNID